MAKNMYATLTVLYFVIYWRELTKIVFEKRDAACAHRWRLALRWRPLRCGNKIQKKK